MSGWQETSIPDYKLGADKDSFKLWAIKGGTKLSATTLDHVVWTELVQRAGPGKSCQTLTLWTRDIEFNAIVLHHNEHDDPVDVRCFYLGSPSQNDCRKHIKFWQTYGVKDRPFSTARRLYDGIPSLVVWNHFELASGPNEDGDTWWAGFKRDHLVKTEPIRLLTQAVPIPNREIEPNSTKVKAGTRADKLLSEVEKYLSFAGRGAPMVRNLEQLSTLIVDRNKKVTLVTGEPGTGKEGYSKALFYGNFTRHKEDNDRREILVSTTAQEATNGGPGLAEETLMKKVDEAPGPSMDKKCPVIFIDELNKVDKHALASMLRPLENGIDGVDEAQFILAASQHIDDLAKMEPQDFWTRVSHQFRIVHPMSRVGAEDARTFLEAFFYQVWKNEIEASTKGELQEFETKTTRLLFGDLSADKIEPSRICGVVRDEFLNTLVPFVGRDTLSIRGAVSIVKQIFARVSWLTRFSNPNDKAESLRTPVNEAIQDVLSVLNASRATPPTTNTNKKAMDS